MIANWYFNDLKKTTRQEGITAHQVYKDAVCGGYANKPMSKFDEMTIVDTLKNVLKLDNDRRMINGVRSTRWYNPDEVENHGLLVPADVWGFDEK
jgi:hypothetical protein